jgi:hypothetical protein
LDNLREWSLGANRFGNVQAFDRVQITTGARATALPHLTQFDEHRTRLI